MTYDMYILYFFIGIAILAVIFFARRRVRTPKMRLFITILIWLIVAYLGFMVYLALTAFS